jgi:hypothetical protein
MLNWYVITCSDFHLHGADTFEAKEMFEIPVYVSRSPLLSEYVRETVASFREWLLQVSVAFQSVPLRAISQAEICSVARSLLPVLHVVERGFADICAVWHMFVGRGLFLYCLHRAFFVFTVPLASRTR